MDPEPEQRLFIINCEEINQKINENEAIVVNSRKQSGPNPQQINPSVKNYSTSQSSKNPPIMKEEQKNATSNTLIMGPGFIVMDDCLAVGEQQKESLRQNVDQEFKSQQFPRTYRQRQEEIKEMNKIMEIDKAEVRRRKNKCFPNCCLVF